MTILIAFMALFGVYAQEVNVGDNNEPKEQMVESGVHLTSFVIDMRNISYPYNIVIGVPSSGGRVLGVSGPADTRIPNWSIDAYNMLTINLTADDLVGLEPDNVRFIEIATENIGYYVEIRGIF